MGGIVIDLLLSGANFSENATTCSQYDTWGKTNADDGTVDKIPFLAVGGGVIASLTQESCQSFQSSFTTEADKCIREYRLWASLIIGGSILTLLCCTSLLDYLCGKYERNNENRIEEVNAISYRGLNSAGVG